MKKSSIVTTMKDFRENIGEDEQMLAFAADNLDTPDEARIAITIDGSIVTFEVLET